MSTISLSTFGLENPSFRVPECYRLTPPVHRAPSHWATSIMGVGLQGGAPPPSSTRRPQRRGGWALPAHRDNPTRGTAHRRFAVAINCNADVDGGEISFPESLNLSLFVAA